MALAARANLSAAKDTHQRASVLAVGTMGPPGFAAYARVRLIPGRMDAIDPLSSGAFSGAGPSTRDDAAYWTAWITRPGRARQLYPSASSPDRFRRDSFDRNASPPLVIQDREPEQILAQPFPGNGHLREASGVRQDPPLLSVSPAPQRANSKVRTGSRAGDPQIASELPCRTGDVKRRVLG
jgi:hypothetical protein